MELAYDKTSSAAAGTSYLNAAYNGNIAGTTWKTAGAGINRKYDFTYDNLNRLTGAAFLQNTSGTSWDRGQVDFTVTGLNYDANGNIKSMVQRGWLVGGSGDIDSMTYSYLNSNWSNRLQGVVDGANNATSQLGDFHYNPATKVTTDYAYDGNGSMNQDNNKNIDRITYNYLNLAQLVHMNGKGNIAYTYDATGAKLKKVTTDSLNRHSTTTLYIGGCVYQQNDTITNPGGGVDTLQFIGHEEGRARWAYHKYTNGASGYKWEYDFFEKDHLGNTRVVLTQQRDTATYLATMESAYRATEAQLFANVATTSHRRASVPNYPADLSVTNPNDSVSKVDFDGSTGQKTGPSLLLKVMGGDTVQCFYNSGSGTTNNTSLADVLNSLAGVLVNMTGGVHGTLANLTTNGSTVYNGVNSFLSTKETTTTGYPKAYLNWIFLDDQFNYVGTLSGSVATASSTYPAGALNAVAPGSPLILNRSGYLYIWASNETQGWDVFFDNFSVQHRQGPLAEENHYYPFGLTMAGISDRALKSKYTENKYRFNFGSELQNKEFSDERGLELYDAHHRLYDPQIGRFGQLDPLGDITPGQSAFTFGSNNPMSHIDPLGLTDTVVTTRTTNLQSVTVYGHKRLKWFYWPESTPSDRATWARNHGLYHDRLSQNQPLSQKGDPASYTASLSMYKQWTKADKESRVMQAWAVGIIGSPALIASAPGELLLAFRIKAGINAGAWAVDAGVQTVVNTIQHKDIFSNYNVISGATALIIGAPEGAPVQNLLGVSLVNSTISSSVNISYNSLSGSSNILGFNPLSIAINTIFGAAAFKASQVTGGGAVGDMLASPFNFAGAGIDEGTKPEEKK